MQETFNLFVQVLLAEAIKVLVPFLVAVVTVWVAYAVKRIRAELGDQRWQAIEQAVRFAVIAAEQVGLKDELLKTGQAKKEYALSQAQKWLNAQGITVDVAYLEGLIETEVGLNLNWDKLVGAEAR